MMDRFTKKKPIKWIWMIYAYALVFISVYNPPIYGVQIIRLVYLLAFLHLLTKKIIFSNITIKLFCYAIGVIIYAFLDSILQFTFDFNTLGISRLFIFIIVSYYVFDCIKYKAKQKIDITTGLKLLAYTSIPQYFLIILSYFSPEFKSFLFSLNGSNAISFELMQIFALTRGIGWTYGQFAGFSILLGMSFMCQLGLWLLDEKNNKRKVLIRIIILTISIIGGSLCARTYQMVVGLAIIYWLSIITNPKNYIRIVGYISLLIIAVIASLPLIFSLLSDYVSEDTLKWAFEFYYNYTDNGTIESKSTNQLMNEMWSLPNNISTWIFGDARMVAESGIHPMYSGSDAGYICSLWGWGILGSLLYYTAIYKSFQYTASLTTNKILRRLVWFLLIIILTYNIKGIETGFPIIFFIYTGLLYVKAENTKHGNNKSSYDSNKADVK